MEISKGIDAVDLGLFIRKSKTLVLADFHIGYEEELNKRGVLVPRMQFRDTIIRLEAILSAVSPKVIVVNGDLKHEFGKISEQEWRETLKLIDFLAKKCKKLVLTKGNHDTILGPIAKKRNIEVADYYIDGSILIIHGDKIPEQLLKSLGSRLKAVVISHEHPAVSIRDGPRVEKFKCFLKGKFRGKTLIVQPSFNQVTEGTNVLSEELLSPFLHQDLGSFRCYVVGEKEIMDFGRLKNLVLKL